MKPKFDVGDIVAYSNNNYPEDIPIKCKVLSIHIENDVFVYNVETHDQTLEELNFFKFVCIENDIRQLELEEMI